MESKVHIIDCTLREGHQAPSVKFTHENSIRVAQLLEPIVDSIEIGHPSASQEEFNRVRAITDLKLRCHVLSHSRAHKGDIQRVVEAKADWVGIFAGINEQSQQYRLCRSEKCVLETIKSCISFAKDLGLKVRYTVEDASRTPENLLIDAYAVAVESFADRICFADTVGILEPHEVHKIVKEIKNNFKYTDLEVHFHDDRGLAMANALSAIAAGANWVSTSVNGIGERCGITDTCAFIANLFYKKTRNMDDIKTLLEISKTIESITGHPVDYRRSVVGKFAFTHKAKLHINAIKKSSNIYNWLDPNYFGLKNEFDN